MKLKNAAYALSLSLVASCASLASASAANELVENGGFQTGTFAGWTQSGFTSSNVGSGWSHNSTFGAHFHLVGAGQGSLFQTIATTANTLYTLSFDILKNGQGSSTFSVLAGSLNLFTNVSRTGTNGWTHYTAQFTANAAPSTLNFVLRTGDWGIDNVSVVRTANVPGPIAGAGLPALLGLMGLGLWHRKRTKTA